MNRQTITGVGEGPASSAPTPCNTTPPVVSSSQSDRIFHQSSMKNFGSSSQAQPTSYQQSLLWPLGGSQGPSETRDRSNRQKHGGEFVREDLEMLDAQPEIDPLGNERVKLAACKEVRRRQLETQNAELNQFMEQSGPGQGPEIESRESEITRLERLMDEQMNDVMGVVDNMESKASFWLWEHQYRSTVDLAGQRQEATSESSQISPSMERPSTCYYWDKHQKDSTQPPCQLGMACRFSHYYIGEAPMASAQYNPEANSRRSMSPESIIRRYRQATESFHTQPNAPSFRSPFQTNHDISRRSVDKTPMKYSPPLRPPGPSPLGSTRSMAELRVPQLSLPLRSKVASPRSACLDTGVNTSGQNSLGNQPTEIADLSRLSKESHIKQHDQSDPSLSFSPTRRYSSKLLSENSGERQQTSEWSNANIDMGLETRGQKRIATEQAFREEEEYGQWFDDNQSNFKGPVKKSYRGTLRFAQGPYVPLLPTSSPEYQVKKLEREFRESEERGEKEIIEQARAKSMGTIDCPEPEEHFRTASTNTLNAEEEEKKIAYGRAHKRELRDTLKDPRYLSDMLDDGASNGTFSSGNVFERPATTVEQPQLNNKPLVIRNRPSNRPPQEPAPGTSAPKVKQLKDKSLTFQQPDPISEPLRRTSIPANVDWQGLVNPLSINPLASTNPGPKVQQPKRQPVNVEATPRPNLGLEKKKWTTAELIHKHKLARQNSEANRETLHKSGVTGTLNEAVGENIQATLRQTEAKKPSPKPEDTDADSQFSDIDLADEESASSGANGSEGEDWIVVENGV